MPKNKNNYQSSNLRPAPGLRRIRDVDKTHFRGGIIPVGVIANHRVAVHGGVVVHGDTDT